MFLRKNEESRFWPLVIIRAKEEFLSPFLFWGKVSTQQSHSEGPTRVNKEQAIVTFFILHLRWKVWLWLLKGKHTDASVEETSDLVLLGETSWIHADLGNTRTQLFCAVQSDGEQGTVAIRIESDHDNPVVSH